MNFLRSLMNRLGLDWTTPPKTKETWNAFLQEIESADLIPIPREELDILKDRALLFSSLLERAPDIILQLDRLGFVREANPVVEKLLGYTPADVLDRHFTSLPFMTPQAVQVGLVEFAANLSGKDRPPFEIILHHRDGHRMVLEGNSRHMEREGRFVGVMAIFRDVTERDRIEADLAEARDAAVESARIKSEFLANMSHEIRTPMNAIIGMTDLLMEMPLEKEQRDYVVTVQRSADHLLQIINDVLDLSKMEAGRMEFRKEDFDLRNLLEEAAQLVAARAQSKGIELVTLVPAEMATSYIGDTGRIQQVVVNLLSNAVKFTEHGEVVVKASVEGMGSPRTVLIEVVDTGIGISDKNKEKLFQSFSQVESSSSRRYGGTGLGLVISKKLIEGMGGSIGFRSDVGKGSTFFFRIPLTEGEPKPPVAANNSTLDGLRVLIVDDNPVNRFLLHQQLSNWGMIDTTVESGQQAIQALKMARSEEKPFDLVILDVAMPGMDGIEVARRIQDEKMSPRIVIMSSLAQPLSPETMASAGISSQLTKPVKQSRLFDSLITILHDEKDERRPTKKSDAPEGSVESRPHLRVLVVDDNEVNQKLTIIQLQKLGLEADSVSTGMEAIEAWKKQTYSLLFMDCQMPEMDGFEATTAIRRLEKGHQRTPIVGLTANSMAGDRERCLASGMDDYLAKPVRLEQLAGMIKKWDVPVDTTRALGVRENVGRQNYIELIKIFTRTSKENMAGIRAAFEKGDRHGIQEGAHTLKGSSANMGARAVQILCMKLHDAAGEKETDLKPLVEGLEKALELALTQFASGIDAADRPAA